MAFNYLKKYWHWPVIILLAACFFVGTSSYIYFTQKNNFVKFSSPDETANYNFAKLYAETGNLQILEKYNLVAGDIIHPRSMRSDLGYVKPVSFLGIIIIYGKIASIFGIKIIPYLTPLFGAIGIIFFYLLIKKLFGAKNALISSFIFAVFPPFMYYSARSMFHNILFMVLLIIGLYFSILLVQKRENKREYINYLFAAIAGLFIGLTIITRTSELIWLLPALLILWIFNIKRIGFVKLIIFLTFVFFAILPVIYWNDVLYSSPLKGGYTEMNQAVTNISQASLSIPKEFIKGKFNYLVDLIKVLKRNIFYFGLKPMQAWKMAQNYIILMFPWLFILGVSGFIASLFRINKWKKKDWQYFLILITISIILIIYYGSWNFHDNPDPTKTTIGNSYTRYWLPVYFGLIPLASYFLIELGKTIF
ncbi:MAG: glycosyltransferase family 39 protein, partial [Patescibacteria group bacterium]|nr:glycosyltransferase family 39 protein [Patescibacteria group bacterium]